MRNKILFTVVTIMPVVFMASLIVFKATHHTLWFLCGISFYWAKILIDYIGKKEIK